MEAAFSTGNATSTTTMVSSTTGTAASFTSSTIDAYGIWADEEDGISHLAFGLLMLAALLHALWNLSARKVKGDSEWWNRIPFFCFCSNAIVYLGSFHFNI